MTRISPVATWQTMDGIGVVTIDSPPVNALGGMVRESIAKGLELALDDEGIRAVILTCAGRTFFAGADISEFGKPPVEPDLNSLVAAIDASPKLMVAAIHGTALGGGLEIALSCHARIAVPSARLGLPEVNLGLLPGAGGTQRLPRLIGAAAALDMMLTGKPVSATAALDVGLIDALAEEDTLLDGAVSFARRHLAAGEPLRRVSQMQDRITADRAEPGLLAGITAKHARLFRGFKAPANIVRAVEAALALPFVEGMARERALFMELIGSPESAAQRHVFFAEREVAKIPDQPEGLVPIDIASVGIIGAGTMGGGIAMNFLDIGLPVTLVETQAEALDRGIATIRKNYEISARKGRLRTEDVEKRMALIRPSLSMDDLADRDLIIEAVYEDLALKKDIFARLDAIAAPKAILASNTSFLDLDAIAAATRRPERVVGLHFFSPANVMRLLEVVRGARTSPDVLAAAMKLGRRIGKVAVVSGVCHGFIANRMMSRRTAQANALILEGPMPWDVDRVMRDFGFAMGTFEMMDLVGNDVIGWDRNNSNGSTVQEVLCEAGRWGIKRSAGYYDYDETRKGTPSPVVEDMIAAFSDKRGIERHPVSDADILERLLFPVVNEGAKILEEGIALRATDIDIALISGYGWPVYKGGPMFWAATVGLDRIVASLKGLEARHGETFRPAALLERLAAERKVFTDP